jgi:DNA processing protein
MPMQNETLSWLRLIRSEGVGPTTFDKLVEEFGNAENALAAMHTLRHRGKQLVSANEKDIEREYHALAKLGGQFILKKDQAYADALRHISDAPPVLSALGNVSLIQKPMLAIIGARNASTNGRKLAAKIARDLGQAGFVIVSGLARGIDAAAHEAALDTGTIGVLANGVDVVYPPENKKLYDAIAERGLLLSENAFGLEPSPQLFPRRNRIVSGLCQGVIIVEAAEKSGSLITARCALDQGREVFAVPGNPLDPRAMGPNALIKRGHAQLIESAEDVLNAFSLFPSQRVEAALAALDDEAIEPSLPSHTDDQARMAVLGCLSPTPCMIDDVVAATKVPVQRVLSILMEMELTGQVQRLSGNRIAKI